MNDADAGRSDDALARLLARLPRELPAPEGGPHGDLSLSDVRRRAEVAPRASTSIPWIHRAAAVLLFVAGFGFGRAAGPPAESRDALFTAADRSSARDDAATEPQFALQRAASLYLIELARGVDHAANAAELDVFGQRFEVVVSMGGVILQGAGERRHCDPPSCGTGARAILSTF